MNGLRRLNICLLCRALLFTIGHLPLFPVVKIIDFVWALDLLFSRDKASESSVPLGLLYCTQILFFKIFRKTPYMRGSVIVAFGPFRRQTKIGIFFGQLQEGLFLGKIH